MISVKKTSLILLCLLFTGPYSFALESDSKQPVNVEADSADIDDEKKRITYIGNVVIIQGSMELYADKVIVQEALNKGQGNAMYAYGKPARFKQLSDGQNNKPGKMTKGRASRIEYFSKSSLIHLIGKAHVDQEGDTMKSDRITYNRDKALVQGGLKAKGKKRVRMQLRLNDS